MKIEENSETFNEPFLFFKIKTGFLWYFKTWHPYKYGFYMIPISIFIGILILFTFFPNYLFVEMMDIKIMEFFIPLFGLIGVILGLIAWGLSAYYLFLDNEL